MRFQFGCARDQSLKRWTTVPLPVSSTRGHSVGIDKTGGGFSPNPTPRIRTRGSQLPLGCTAARYRRHRIQTPPLKQWGSGSPTNPLGGGGRRARGQQGFVHEVLLEPGHPGGVGQAVGIPRQGRGGGGDWGGGPKLLPKATTEGVSDNSSPPPKPLRRGLRPPQRTRFTMCHVHALEPTLPDGAMKKGKNHTTPVSVCLTAFSMKQL